MTPCLIVRRILRLDRERRLALSLTLNHFRAFPRQPQIPVGRQAVISLEAGLRGWAVADFEDRRCLMHFIEHGNVDHLHAEVCCRGELPPIELAAQPGNRCARCALALEVRPPETRIDDWK